MAEEGEIGPSAGGGPLREIAESDIASLRVRDACAYWRDAAGPKRAFPDRADLDPVDVPHLLSQLMLTDVVTGAGGGVDFRVRLFGTYLVDLFGYDYTAWLVGEVPIIGATVFANLRKLQETGAPVFIENTLSWREREFVRYHVAHLPLGPDNDTVTMTLTAVDAITAPY